MSKPIDVLAIAPGAIVTVTSGVEGVVTKVLVEHNQHVSYEVAYWTNGIRQVAWFTWPEVRIMPDEPLLGFHFRSEGKEA